MQRRWYDEDALNAAGPGDDDLAQGPRDVQAPAGGPLARALWALRVGARRGQDEDGYLVGREAEQEDMEDFLMGGIRVGGTREVLYISGMPGTGKTASVMQVLRKVKTDPKFRHPFTLVHVNAMCLATPGAIFAEICRKIPAIARCCRGRMSETQAHAALHRFFSEPTRRPVVVLLLDELDSLLTQAQTVLYRLFDFLTMPNAGIVMMSIANMMNLPSRLLPRVSSRLGVRRLDFAHYDKNQLHAILTAHLEAGRAEHVFSRDALMICATSISGRSGDARKALQVCRRAVEVRLSRAEGVPPVSAEGGRVGAAGVAELLEDGRGPISIAEIMKAEGELLRVNPAYTAIKHLSLKTRRLILAIALELRQRPETKALPVKAAVRRYEGLVSLAERELSRGETTAAACSHSLDDWEIPSPMDDALFNLKRLEAMALIKGPPDGFESAMCGGMLLPGQLEADVALELSAFLDLDGVSDALLAAPSEDPLAKDLLGYRDRGPPGAAAPYRPVVKAATV